MEAGSKAPQEKEKEVNDIKKQYNEIQKQNSKKIEQINEIQKQYSEKEEQIDFNVGKIDLKFKKYLLELDL